MLKLTDMPNEKQQDKKLTPDQIRQLQAEKFRILLSNTVIRKAARSVGNYDKSKPK
jgi:hypothetical protein